MLYYVMCRSTPRKNGTLISKNLRVVSPAHAEHFTLHRPPNGAPPRAHPGESAGAIYIILFLPFLAAQILPTYV